MEKLKELKENLASLETQFQQIKADMGEEDKYNAIFDYFQRSIGRLADYIFAIEDELYRHKEGHIPKLNAGAMQKLLKSVGLDDSYEVKKPVIYVKANRLGKKEFNVSLNMKGKPNE